MTVQRVEQKAKDRRFWVGVILTVSWLVVLSFMYFNVQHPENLNSWGDFFSGAFAPLAFLWLVLGYMQQGAELRLSTHALNLQAEELKNSVEQQSQLVEISRKQLEQEIDAVKHERQLQEEQRAAEARRKKPRFAVRVQQWASNGNISTYTLKIMNIGGTVTSVYLETACGESRHTEELAALHSGTEKLINLRITDNADGLVRISALDSDGLGYVVSYTVKRHDDGTLTFKVFEEATY